MQPPALKRRRRIVISSDSEDGGVQVAFPPLHSLDDAQDPKAEAPHNDAAPEHSAGIGAVLHGTSAPDSPVDLLNVPSDSGSSDSDDPVSRGARKLALANAIRLCDERAELDRQDRLMSPFLYAAKYGRFPDKGAIPSRTPPPQLQIQTQEDGYLWNALPPVTSQFLDNEAAHGGSTSSGSTGASDGSLSDGFIDKEAVPDFSTDEQAVLEKFFPLTAKKFITQATKNRLTAPKTSNAHSPSLPPPQISAVIGNVE